MAYKIKELIDKGFNPSEITDELFTQTFTMFKNLSQNFTFDNPTAHMIDEELVNIVRENRPELFADEAPDTDITEPVEEFIPVADQITEPTKPSNPFIADNFFKEHPENVLGEEIEGQGKWGTTLTVKGNPSIVDTIDVPAVENLFVVDTTLTTVPAEQIIDKVFDNQAKLEVDELMDKRQITVTKRDTKDKVFTFRQVVEKYNKDIDNEEMQAYLWTNPELPYTKYFDKYTLTEEEMISKGLIFYETVKGEPKFVYKYVYLSGNISDKIDKLNQFTGADESKMHTGDGAYIIDKWGQAVYDQQLQLLNEYRPEMKRIGDIADLEKKNDEEDNKDSIVLVPHSELVKQFKVSEVSFVSTIFNPAKSLFEIFLDYVRDYLPSSEFGEVTRYEIIDYYLLPKSTKKPSNMSPEQADKYESRENFKKTKCKDIGDLLFKKFIIEELQPQDRVAFEYEWNKKYNNLRLPVYEKIPVGFTISQKFKTLPLELTPVQRNSVAFINYTQSGVLALDVGLGKTLSSVAAISQAVENGYAKYPLIVCPNSVHDQWLYTIEGYFDPKKGIYMKGALPHFPKVRDLYNCGVEYIKQAKVYTKDEEDKIVASISEQTRAAKMKDDFEKGKITEIDPALFSDDYPFVEVSREAKFRADNTITEKKAALLQAKNEDKIDNWSYSDNLRELEKQVIPVFYKQFAFLMKKYYNYLVYSTGEFPKMEAGTITLMTFEGMENMGVRDNAEMVDHLYNIIEQGDVAVDPKRAAITLEKLKKVVASSIGSPKLYIEDLLIDMLIIDEAHKCKYIFSQVKGKIKKDREGKDVFKEDKTSGEETGKADRETSSYQLDTGRSTPTALRGYIFSTYVQQRNNNRNVILLSATPFENHPLEIYSILSLANHQLLVDMGFEHINDFFDTFMKINFGLKLDVTGHVVEKPMLLGYQNLRQMRNVIRNIIFHKTGEEAKIGRPNKYVLPTEEPLLVTPQGKKPLHTAMIPTPDQVERFKMIERYITYFDPKKPNYYDTADFESDWVEALEIEATADDLEQLESEAGRTDYLDDESEALAADEEVMEQMDEDEKAIHKNSDKGIKVNEKHMTDATNKKTARILQAISLLKKTTIQPLIFAAERNPAKYLKLITAKRYVETSPKLLYVAKCIKSSKEWAEARNEPVSGKIIYMNFGVQLFPRIKEYLTRQEFGIGFAPEEVAILTSAQSKAAKEKIKEKFNDGTVKVLIGSKTIEVGVDLQTYTTELYDLDLDWNPTGVNQVIGRCWRQGNTYQNVRIVFPMVENSIDMILFQYLGEKTARLKDIWDLDSVKSQLDLRDFDPFKLQRQILTDPVKLAYIEAQQEINELQGKLAYMKNIQSELWAILPSKKNFATYLGSIRDHLGGYHNDLYNFRVNVINNKKYQELNVLEDEKSTIERPLIQKQEEKDELQQQHSARMVALESSKTSKLAEFEPELKAMREKLMDLSELEETEKVKADIAAQKAAIAQLRSDYAEDGKHMKAISAKIAQEEKEEKEIQSKIDKEIAAIRQTIGEKLAAVVKKIDAITAKFQKELDKELEILTRIDAKINGGFYNDKYAAAMADTALINKGDILEPIDKNVYDRGKAILPKEDEKRWFNYVHQAFLYRAAKEPVDWYNNDGEGMYSNEMYNSRYNSTGRRVFNSYREHFAEYYDLMKRIIKPMDIAEDDIEQATAMYNEKIKAINNQLESIDDGMPDRIDKYRDEMDNRVTEDLTPAERAQQFASINDLMEARVTHLLTARTVSETDFSKVEILQNLIGVVKYKRDNTKKKALPTKLGALAKALEHLHAYSREEVEAEFAKGGNIDHTYNYMMLDRLRQDCDYYLGNGNKNEKHLWAGSVEGQIKEMKQLWNKLPEDKKPEWLSMQDILDYEKKMQSSYGSGGLFNGSLKVGSYVDYQTEKETVRTGKLLSVKKGEATIVDHTGNIVKVATDKIHKNQYIMAAKGGNLHFGAYTVMDKENIEHVIYLKSVIGGMANYREDGKGRAMPVDQFQKMIATKGAKPAYGFDYAKGGNLPNFYKTPKKVNAFEFVRRVPEYDYKEMHDDYFTVYAEYTFPEKNRTIYLVDKHGNFGISTFNDKTNKEIDWDSGTVATKDLNSTKEVFKRRVAEGKTFAKGGKTDTYDMETEDAYYVRIGDYFIEKYNNSVVNREGVVQYKGKSLKDAKDWAHKRYEGKYKNVKSYNPDHIIARYDRERKGKIDLFYIARNGDWHYIASTNSSKTCKEAVAKYIKSIDKAAKNKLDLWENNIKYKRGGSVAAGEWVVYNGNTYEIVSIEPNHSAAKKKMDANLHKLHYIGIEAKSSWDEWHANGGELINEPVTQSNIEFVRVDYIIEHNGKLVDFGDYDAAMEHWENIGSPADAKFYAQEWLGKNAETEGNRYYIKGRKFGEGGFILTGTNKPVDTKAMTSKWYTVGDSQPVTFLEFYTENTAEGVEPLQDYEFQEIFWLKIGETFQQSPHAEPVTRVAAPKNAPPASDDFDYSTLFDKGGDISLKKGDWVKNAVGETLVVYAVEKSEYIFIRFGGAFPFPFTKETVHKNLSNGTWQKVKGMAEGGDLDADTLEISIRKTAKGNFATVNGRKWNTKADWQDIGQFVSNILYYMNTERKPIKIIVDGKDETEDFIKEFKAKYEGTGLAFLLKNLPEESTIKHAEGGSFCPVGTSIQTLIFSKKYFSKTKAKAWAKKHKFTAGVDEKAQTYRLRQINPDKFDDTTFRTISITKGIKAVIGCPIN